MDLIIDKFGRVVIPKKIRDRLGLQPGTRLRLDIEAREDQECLALAPVREEPVLQRRGRLLVHTGEIVGDVEEAIRRDREERSRKLSGL